jgi:hypothetical protein
MYRVILPLLVLVAATLAGAQATQPAKQADQAERLRSLLAQLADQDAATRDRARIELMGMSRTELTIFRQVVEKSRPLLPSQAAVLREIVSQAYLAAEPYPRVSSQGFLGVRLAAVELPDSEEDQFRPGGAVLIVGRLLGFAGYRYLYDGDVIIGLGGPQPVLFQTDTQLAQTVQSIAAGTVVPFQVLRQGRLIEVSIPLDARPVELNQTNDLNDTNLQRLLAADNYWKREFAPLLEKGVS